MNTFSLREEQSETGYLKLIDCSFSDESTLSVASLVGGSVSLTSPLINHKIVRANGQYQSNLLASQIPKQVEDNHTQKNVSPEYNHDQEIDNSIDTNSPSSFFEKDQNGFLVSNTRDYKGKNKKLQQQGFSILYVWAYELLLKSFVSKEHLNKAAKNNGIYDQNYSHYLKDTANRFFMNIDNTFKLNPAGKNEVEKIIAEICSILYV